MSFATIPTDTPAARAALSQTLRMMGTAGVEMQQARAGVQMAFRQYRRAQVDAKRTRVLASYLTPAQARINVRMAIIRLRLARVCG